MSREGYIEGKGEQMPVSEADVIAVVRSEVLAPSTLSDEDLMKVMEGSLLLARIRMRFALREFQWAVLESPLGRFVRWLVRAIHKVIERGR